MIKKFENIDFDWTELKEISEFSNGNTTYARVSLPADSSNANWFSKKGYSFIDRTIEVKIPLKRAKIEFEKMVRMPIEISSDYLQEIEELALNSFQSDSRFNVSFDESKSKIYSELISCWANEVDTYFVCIYKNKLIGFLGIKEDDEGVPFIYFAATDEKYRLTGVALSLYSYVANYYKEKGASVIYGRISSQNVAVMNIYAALGAQFYNPWDVFIKE